MLYSWVLTGVYLNILKATFRNANRFFTFVVGTKNGREENKERRRLPQLRQNCRKFGQRQSYFGLISSPKYKCKSSLLVNYMYYPGKDLRKKGAVRG